MVKYGSLEDFTEDSLTEEDVEEILKEIEEDEEDSYCESCDLSKYL